MLFAWRSVCNHDRENIFGSKKFFQHHSQRRITKRNSRFFLPLGLDDRIEVAQRLDEFCFLYFFSCSFTHALCFLPIFGSSQIDKTSSPPTPAHLSLASLSIFSKRFAS